jgi:hypothetical protein
VQEGEQKRIKEVSTPATLRKGSVYLSTIERIEGLLSRSVLVEAPNIYVVLLLAAKVAIRFVCALLGRLKHDLHDVVL